MEAKKQNVLNPITLLNPVGVELAYIFDSHGIHDYESALGIKDLISKEKLTNAARKKAAEVLKIPELYVYLTRLQDVYREAKKKYQASESYKTAKQNYNSLKDVGKLLKGEFTDGFDVLSDIVDFFGVESEEEVFQNCKADGALFRRQNMVEVNAVNLHGWLRRGELDFRKLSLAEYDEAALQAWIDSRAWEAHIEDKEYFLSLPTVFATYGVGLVFVPFLPKTVYGAVRWFEGKPLVQISDLNKDLATCWFTLFHELGHVLKHRGVKIYEGEINEVNAQQNAQEREANKYANGYLFNGDDLRKAVFARHSAGESMKAAELAEEFGVHPLFTAYWLRKAQHKPKLQRKIYIDFSSPSAATEAADSIMPLSAPPTEP